MEPTIRVLASHRGNLFVLEEYNPLEWLIKSYREGFYELKERTQKFFWFELSLPILKNRAIIEEARRLGAEARKVKGAEAKQFYDTFIQEQFLKAYPDLCLDEYLQQMCDSPTLHPKEVDKEATEKAISVIYADPATIGLPPGGKFYEEVNLTSRFSQRFDDIKSFKEYLSSGEVSTASKGLTQLDLVYVVSKDDGVPEVYAIELKGTITKKAVRKTRWKARRQLTITSHFIKRNFDVDLHLVRVNHLTKHPRALRSTYYDFYPDPKRIEIKAQTDWVEI